IPFYLQRAYVEANSGRKGAVHLTIPVDLFTESTHETSGRAWPGVDEPASLWGGPDGRPNSVGTAIEMLRGAHRPIVIAGSGVWWSHGENALRQFIERTNIPLYTITMGRAAVADDHPLVMGYADPALNHAVHAAFREADVFLIVGKRIDYRLAMGGARLFPAHAKFIQVDIHPQELGLNHALEAAICADARAALESLTAAAGASAWPAGPWLDRVRALREAWKSRLAADAADGA